MVDFTGWRYFELVEPESRRWALYAWPYGDPYSIYRESVNFSQVASLSIWFNNIPPGKAVTCYLSPIKAMPLLTCCRLPQAQPPVFVCRRQRSGVRREHKLHGALVQDRATQGRDHWGMCQSALLRNFW